MRCCWGTCNSDSRYPERCVGVTFIPFAKAARTKPWNHTKSLRWIKACGRPHQLNNVDKITKNHYVCSKHFVDGKPTAENPDPIPAVPIVPSVFYDGKRKLPLVWPTPTFPKQHMEATEMLSLEQTAASELPHSSTGSSNEYHRSQMSEVMEEQAPVEQPPSPASLKQKSLSNGAVHEENGVDCNGRESAAEGPDTSQDESEKGAGNESLGSNGAVAEDEVEEKMDCDKDNHVKRDNKTDDQNDKPVSPKVPEKETGGINTDSNEDSNRKQSNVFKDVAKKITGKDGEEKTNGKNKTDLSCVDSQTVKKDTVERPSKKIQRHDSDDIQIVGESKVINVSAPSSSRGISQQNVVFVPASLGNGSKGMMGQGFAATNVMSPNLHSSQWVPTSMVGPGGHIMQASAGMVKAPTMPSVAPPQPKSSLDQIELIRWEIHNRINSRPKYFKPNNSSELGPLSKFLFDIGSDLIKETVYHELVKIQSKKDDDSKLTDKEKDDLAKLKDIEKDLHATIGHLKLKMKKRCKTCNFQTESTNVLYMHKQFPHEQEKKLLCAHCNYTTKQAMSYKFHVEAEHDIQPRVHDKKAFYECDLCPYENNQEHKVVAHKQRCSKQFRPLFNLHPSCLAGAEINLCLENIFYKPAISKHLKILQQKHAQQQAALLEAKRQQAHVQALAAQKNAAAAAKRQQQQQLLQQQHLRQQQAQMNAKAMKAQAMAVSRMALPTNRNKTPNQPVRTVNKAQRPTVANILNSRQGAQQPPSQPHAPPQGAQGFEVCEICGGYVKDRKALRIHFFYAHRIDLPFNLFERAQAPLYCATCYVRFWTAQGLRKHIDTHKEENIAQGVVGKCISCGHHVLNLLIHMRIVHSREIQHYINALMCMFCGSHFNARNDVERHIRFVHGTVDPVTGTVKPGVGTSRQVVANQTSKAPSKKTSAGGAVKGSVCVLCNLNFGRNVDLTRHCMRMHHTCMKCGMVVIDKASLMKHICLNSPSGTRNCCMCSEKGFHPAYYVKHLRDKHLKKFSVRVGRLSKATVERYTKRPYPFQDPEEICVEISDSDDEVREVEKSKIAPAPTKKQKIGPAFFMKKKCVEIKEVVNLDDEGEGNIADIGEKSNNNTKKKGNESISESENENNAVDIDKDDSVPTQEERKRKSLSEEKDIVSVPEKSPTCEERNRKSSSEEIDIPVPEKSPTCEERKRKSSSEENDIPEKSAKLCES